MSSAAAATRGMGTERVAWWLHAGRTEAGHTQPRAHLLFIPVPVYRAPTHTHTLCKIVFSPSV